VRDGLEAAIQVARKDKFPPEPPEPWETFVPPEPLPYTAVEIAAAEAAAGILIGRFRDIEEADAAEAEIRRKVSDITDPGAAAPVAPPAPTLVLQPPPVCNKKCNGIKKKTGKRCQRPFKTNDAARTRCFQHLLDNQG